VLLLATPCLAETRSGLVLRPFPEGRGTELSGEVDAYLDSETDDGFDYGMRVFAFSGRAQLVPQAGRGSPVAGWQFLYFDVDSPDPRLPGELFEASFAVGGSLRAGDWTLQGTAGAGFAGDEAATGWYGLASASATRVFGPGHVLSIGLDFDGNRPIFPDVPLPVVVWTRRWNEHVTTSLGVPFLAVTWTPADWIEIAARGIPGVFATGGVTVFPAEDWEVFARFRSRSFRFFVEGDDRLFYSESRVEIGAGYKGWKLMAGWAFEREFETGFDVRDTDTLARVDEGWVVALSFTLAF